MYSVSLGACSTVHPSKNSSKSVLFLRGTARSAKRVLAIVILSVRPSVCLLRPGTDSTGQIETVGFRRMIAQSL